MFGRAPLSALPICGPTAPLPSAAMGLRLRARDESGPAYEATDESEGLP